jgi:hypothetical protein
MMSDRSPHYRQPPLEHCGRDVECVEFDDESTRIYAAPGYMIFIERMWHGEYQQVPVDPDKVLDLIDALHVARRHARVEPVDA